MTASTGEDLTELAAAAILDLHHPVKAETAEWARRELGAGDLVAADRDSTFADDDWRRCAERGILGLFTAERYGGRGADLITALLTLEGLGLGCPDNGLTFAVVSQLFSTQSTLDRFADDEQRERWLPGLCDGSVLGAFAITEPDSGSDVYAMASTALPDGAGRYRLSGHKAYLTFGSRCDVVVVFAATNPDAGRWGISAFLVPTDRDGVERTANREKMGMRTTPFGDIVFHDVALTDDDRIGPEGSGASIFHTVLERERAFVFAAQIGAMERQLDRAIEYARTRRQGGRTIGDYQAVSHRIVDMKVRHETARLFLYKAALLESRGQPITMAAALSKLVASEHAMASSIDAIRTHGAIGYVSEYEVERDLRDAVGGPVYSGTSDIQRNIVARLLGLG